MTKRRISLPKERGGVYLLKHRGVVVYVGRSSNILCRIAGHRDKAFDDVQFIFCNREAAALKEQYLIRGLKPKLNVNKLTVRPKRFPTLDFIPHANIEKLLSQKITRRVSRPFKRDPYTRGLAQSEIINNALWAYLKPEAA